MCVGNSSSGIKETAAFCCPTINIGDRQEGRLTAKNVINIKAEERKIFNQINKCLDNYESYLINESYKNPYGVGKAAKKIASILKNAQLNEKYLVKKNI